ncbi:MAG: hypothetical protein JW712_08625 [Dehalococcoidales bacterium]|nr:hypothetical protein [Dehalococcoidales bacterium]
MNNCEIIDTFPSFLSYWDKAKSLPVEEQITVWEREYMSSYPELLQKQIRDYADNGQDWRDTAREKVFPFFVDRLYLMVTAHDNLLTVVDTVYKQAGKQLGYSGNLTFVIYVGIALGAGWATKYNGSDAVLYGLENIAELGWQDSHSLSRLTAHELGHLWHFSLREQAGYTSRKGSWWQLYTEGIANRCEDLLTGETGGHIFAMQENWLDWCRENKAWLAGDLLKTILAGESTVAFFSSWYGIDGYFQTGYFLGQEIIKHLETGLTLREIALMEHPEGVLRSVLESFISGSP